MSARDRCVESIPDPLISFDRASFISQVKAEGMRHHRDFIWRETSDPYAILVSEVMLQQTQVTRVERFFPRWLEFFPTIDALAAAPLSLVLELWQGMGYNRRAKMLKSACEICSEQYVGKLPEDSRLLLSLPGVGPSTAAGVRIFAYGIPDMYLETNVRTVFLHELFPGQEGVSDRALIPLIQDTCDHDDPRRWYYDLMDYGAYLKQTIPNPSRASKHYTRQSAFEGSSRQKRSLALRLCLEEGMCPTDLLAERMDAFERARGRGGMTEDEVYGICSELALEGMLELSDGCWRVP
jgi:A/G-specific adenine glycosylase